MSDKLKMWLMFYGPVYGSCLVVAVMILVTIVNQHNARQKDLAEQRAVWMKTYAAYFPDVNR